MTTIGDVVASVETWNPARSTSVTPFPYIDLSAIDQERKRISGVRSTLPAEAPSRARQLVRKGDVLVSTVRPNLNAVAYVTSEFDGATVSTGFTVLRPTKATDGRYLFHWVRTPTFIGSMVREATGASYPAVSDRTVKTSLIPLPPLEEQRHLAAILDRADSIRDLHHVGWEPIRLLPESIYQSLPCFDSWPRMSLAEVCASPDDIKCGPFGTQLKAAEFRPTGVPLWGIKQVNRGFSVQTEEFLDEGTAARLSAYDILPGDVVMTRKGTVGNCAVYPSGQPAGIMHSDLLRIRVDNSRVLPEFLSHQLHHSAEIAAQLARHSSGAVMPGLNVTKLRSLDVRVPELSIQQEFVQRLKRWTAVRQQWLILEDGLSSLFGALQSRAFSGQL